MDIPARTTAPRAPSAATAADAVLTHAPLLARIVSFQPGLPGAVARLVRRFEADGWIRRTRCTRRSTRSAVVYVVSRISGPIWPPRQWRLRCALEACAAYDDADAGFPVLRRLLHDVTANNSKRHRGRQARARAREHAHRRVWAAAAAVGRVAVLQWMRATYGCVGAVHVVLRSCALTALRHGQLPVLEWIERTFSARKLRRVLVARTLPGPPQRRNVVAVDVSDAVSNGHEHVVRWLQTRDGFALIISGAALRAVVERGDVVMLRLLRGLVSRSNHALVAYAVASDQAGTLAVLVDECAARVTMRTLERALARGHSACVACLLARHEALRLDDSALAPLPRHVMERVRSHGVVGETVTHRALRLLLQQYPTEAIAAALVKYAPREHSAKGASARIWQLLDDEATRPLPLPAVAYARRVRSDALGPLARAAVSYSQARALYDEELSALAASASRSDTQDAVLALLFQGASKTLARILAATSHCDVAFSALCAALCEHDAYVRSTRALFT